MPRTRLINPEFFLHEGLGQASPHARLLFIALWTQADREGRLRWLPLKIHGETFPHEPDLSVEGLATELREAGVLLIYRSGGRDFGYMPGFTRWQKPHRNETPSSLPRPPEGLPEDDHRTTEGTPCTSYLLPVTSPNTSPNTSPTSTTLEVCPTRSRERSRPGPTVPTGDDTLDFLLTSWDGLLGKPSTLEDWLSTARDAYPGVDLLGEARRAKEWELANPDRKKKRVRAFLSRWWTKAQDSYRHPTGRREVATDDEALAHARALGAEL